jgi:hypothetical protein
VPLFGFLMLFVLGMMLVISPALTSQTINGDRERGTLATLQVTRLRPSEIALGKLLAGWAVGLVALALTLPATGLAMVDGGITIGRVAAVYAMVALLIGVVCAISQAFSAVLARSITSALLAYLTVAFLSLGTVIAFGFAEPLVDEERQVQTPEGFVYTDTIARPDRIWWILAANPFVVVADAAPRVPPRVMGEGDVIIYDDYDPLSALGRTVRGLRRPPTYPSPDGSFATPASGPDYPPVWPYGLGIDVLIGVAAVGVTTWRLRTPTARLPRGVRIA